MNVQNAVADATPKSYCELKSRFLRLPPLSSEALVKCIEATAVQEGIKIVRAVIFTHDTWIDPVYVRKTFPCVVVGNQYSFGEAGVQVELCGISRIHADLVEYVIDPTQQIIGAYQRIPGQRQLWISGLDSKRATFSECIEGCYADSESILERYGFLPDHLARTWYFLQNIEQNYAEFNLVRDRYFDKWSVSRYPASTAVGADFRGRTCASCMFDAYDLRPRETSIRTLSARSQCDPSNYAIRFSRASTVDLRGRRTIYISGTSSIDSSGRSIQRGVYEQTEAVLLTIRELLWQAGASLADVQSCYVYATDSSYESAWRSVLASHSEKLEYLLHRASICRDDLSLEVELRAHTLTPAAEGNT